MTHPENGLIKCPLWEAFARYLEGSSINFQNKHRVKYYLCESGVKIRINSDDAYHPDMPIWQWDGEPRARRILKLLCENPDEEVELATKHDYPFAINRPNRK